MKLSTEKIRESLIASFAENRQNGLFETAGELNLFRKDKYYVFAVEVMNSDGSKSFWVWRPDTNERQVLPYIDGAEQLPKEPVIFDKECVENGFLRFTIRKRLGCYRFYLDYKEDYTFPVNEQAALQKAQAFLLTEKDGAYWDAVWRGELKLQPGLFNDFPFYGVFENSYLRLLTGLNCQWAAGKIFVELHEPQTIPLKKQNAVAQFDGHNFVFEQNG